MSMRKVLVVGRSGQVAQSLAEAALSAAHRNLVCLGRDACDIGDRESVRAAVHSHEPDVIVNAAAYTAVDQAETDADAAFLINEQGPRFLAEAAAEHSIPLIHLSTDYVFDGRAAEPYAVDAPTKPLGVYGASKLAGEKAVEASGASAVILRTAWVYGAYGKNFLKTMLRVAEGRDELGVVDDQRGAPTSSHDIARVILHVADVLLEQGRPVAGTYHLVADGEATWADFAEAIFAESERHGGPTAIVNRITTADYPTPAARPAYSVLDSQSLKTTFGVELPYWTAPIESVVQRVLAAAD